MNEYCLVIDKEPGPTSFDVVRRVKGLLPGLKVGHGGSLDPFASGVLILLLGRATKMSGALLNADKSYRATVKLGEATDTMDRTGEVIKTVSFNGLAEGEIVATLRGYEGVWMQTPPMFSAKKIRGVRLYELARQKINVRRLPSPVHLYRVEFLRYQPPFIELEVDCSKGTYIRSLADDIGRRLGTVAHLAELSRLACGHFRLEESARLEQLKREPERFLREGYHHYVRLLRSEALLRKPTGEIGVANSLLR